MEFNGSTKVKGTRQRYIIMQDFDKAFVLQVVDHRLLNHVMREEKKKLVL